MYATGALVLLAGLEEGSAAALGRLETGPFLAYRDTPLTLQGVSPPEGLAGPHSLGRLVEATVSGPNGSLPVKILVLDDLSLLGLETPPPDTVAMDAALRERGGISLGANIMVVAGEGTWEGSAMAVPSSDLQLPDTWILLNASGVRAALRGPGYSLLVGTWRADALRLEAAGYTVLFATSGGEFFVATLGEAQGIVLSIVAVSSVTIALLTFTLLTLEIHYRRREMRTLLGVGMDPRGLGTLYGLQAAYLAMAGTALGVALGVAIAHGLVSFAPLFGLPTILRPQVTTEGLLLPLAASAGAGLAGGLLALGRALRGVRRAA